MAKVSVAYVNHKCAAVNDARSSTHAKACKLFLDDWIGAGAMVIEPPGALSGEAAAAEYGARLNAIPELILPRVDGLPQFDMIVTDLGFDGRIGSLHPYRSEVLATAPWILSVGEESPESITFSLPVILACREVVVVACGSAEKDPASKADALARALEGPMETPRTLPASAVRGCASWIVDKAAASKLSLLYRHE